MTKQYVIMEVVPILDSAEFKPTGCSEDDGTWIDSRHVIDREILRQRLTNIIVSDHEGWSLRNYVDEAFHLILDPPKLEGDQFWTWADGHPNPNDERFWNTGERKFNLNNYDRACKAWLAKMPRKP